MSSEHEFRPKLFMKPADFVQRMMWLKERGFRIVALDRAVDEFVSANLPNKTVVITIDDGFSTVRSVAAPILKRFDFPATVYVSTYFMGREEPVYNILIDYILWKSGTEELVLPQGQFRQESIPNGATANSAERAACAHDIAERLGVDVAPVVAARSFHLMTAEEIQQLEDYNIDVQLHTHRHRWSLQDLVENERELRDNSESLKRLCNHPLVHFCYPTGVFNPDHTDWVGSMGLKSATTMERGVNHIGQSQFALRRITDGSNVSRIEFEAEFCGATQFFQAMVRRVLAIGRQIFHRPPIAKKEMGQDKDAYEQAGTERNNALGIEPRDKSASGTSSFNPTDYLVRGSAWFVVLRWAIRSIGLLSTIILARLLTPDDFGLITMATLIVGFVVMFTESGQTLALIRHSNPNREHFDTAWTIGILMSSLGALLVAVSAPLAELIFHDARAVPLILLLALRTFIAGFENNGVIGYRRDFRFGREFVYLIMCKFLPFVILLVSAYFIRNYLAFGIGFVGGQILSVAFSYLIHPFRPRLSLSRFHELWNYSWWMLLISVADQVSGRFEEFVAGRLFGTRALGLYNVALDVAYAPTDELILPLNRNLFAVYSRIRHDLKQISAHYRQVLSATATVSIATGLGVSLVARDLVDLIFGERWLLTVPLIQCLALGQAIDPILASIVVVFNVTGAERRSVALNWTRVVLVVPFAVVFGELWGIEGIAVARLLVILLVAPLFFRGLCLTIGIGYREIFGLLWRPALAGICMAATLIGRRADFIDLPPAVELLTRMLMGASVFIGVLTLSWFVVGRPEGFERVFVTRLTMSLRALARRRSRYASRFEI